MKHPLSPLAQITLFFLIPFLMGTAIDLYVPSLPHIAHYFSVPRHLAQLTIGLYMLGYSIGQFFLGILSDSIGRRNVLLFGQILFVIASILAVYASSVYWLIVYRILQGLGMAGMGVMCRIIAVDCFSDIALNKKLTYYTSSWTIGPIIGPAIGGYLQHFFQWQANFIYFTIFSGIILLLSLVSIPETHMQRKPLQFKLIGNNLKTILSHQGFLLCVATGSIIYACMVVFNVVGPFLVQQRLHFSVISYGHIALFLGVGSFLGAFSNRLLLNYFKPLSIFAIGLSLLLLMAFISIMTAYLWPLRLSLLIIPVFAFLFFSGLIFTNIATHALHFFPKLAGTAGAVYGTIAAGTIFIVTSSATLLGTDSQKPLFYYYTGLYLLTLLLFLLFRHQYKS